jgi:hypothetical protein
MQACQSYFIHKESGATTAAAKSEEPYCRQREMNSGRRLQKP